MNNNKPEQENDMPGLRSQIVFAVMITVIFTFSIIAVAQFSGVWPKKPKSLTPVYQSKLTLEQIPFNGQRAYEYLKQLSAIGPRCTGSEGMKRQQELITKHFENLPCTIERQEFVYPNPQTGAKTPGCNLIVHWKPERTNRILLCTHYDTLPFPFLDKTNPRGVFVGANDGASGTALLMELGNMMDTIVSSESSRINQPVQSKTVSHPSAALGVDFVFLDAEEFLFSPEGRFFVGSEFFASEYKNNPHRGYKYVYGVLLDMIGDADLQIYYERTSISWRDSSPIARQIWAIAKKLNVKEFIPASKYYISDDHLMLHDLGGIPCIDIIDFDYPSWHTCNDVPENCSALSLAKVGWVISEWIKQNQ